MARFPDPQLADQWRRRLGRFHKSDLTVGQFCHREGYSVASFYRWRHKLDTGQQSTAGGAFVAVSLASAQVCDRPESMIQIELPGGAVVRLDANSQQHVLQNSIAAIVQATSAGRTS